ncbi:MAG: hypothetical protein QM811_08280 [Pirellulales bacterium]
MTSVARRGYFDAPWSIFVAWCGAFLGTWFVLTSVFAIGIRKLPEAIYNSDLVMGFMVMRDVFRDPVAIFDWQLSPAIYAFPDWTLIAALELTPIPRVWNPLIYCGILTTIDAFAVAWMFREARLTGRVSSILLAVAVFGGLFLLGAASPSGMGIRMLFFTCTSYIHSGAIMSGLLLIPLLAKVFQTEGSVRWLLLGLAAVLIGLASYSDTLFVVWFLVPVCAAYCLNHTALGFLKKFFVCCVLIGLGIGGIALDRLRYPAHGIATDVGVAMKVFGQSFIKSFSAGQWPIYIGVIVGVVMLGRAVILIFSRRARDSARADSIELAIVMCNASALLVTIVTGAFNHDSAYRYALPMFLLPYVWTTFVLLRFRPGGFHLRNRYILVAGLLIAALVVPRGVKAMRSVTEPSAQVVELRAGFDDRIRRLLEHEKHDLQVELRNSRHSVDGSMPSYDVRGESEMVLSSRGR